MTYFCFLTLRSRFSLSNQQFHYSNIFKTFRTVTSYKSPHRCRPMRKKEHELSVTVTEDNLCLQCIPQGAHQLAEARAAMWLVGPAARKQGVDGGRAELRFRESNPRLQLIDHLTILQPEEWLLGQGEYLPHTHTLLSTHMNSCIGSFLVKTINRTMLEILLLNCCFLAGMYM